MNLTELKFASTALRELYFISNKPKSVIDTWIIENGYNVNEISEFLNSITVEKRMKGVLFGNIDRKTALENMNREIVAFNIYFPERMVGQIRHIIAAHRLTQGLTQTELAEIVGIRNATISDFEKGKYNLGSDKLEAIMHELGLTISEAGSARQKENKTGNSETVD